jgi:hypothetical protein
MEAYVNELNHNSNHIYRGSNSGGRFQSWHEQHADSNGVFQCWQGLQEELQYGQVMAGLWELQLITRCKAVVDLLAL